MPVPRRDRAIEGPVAATVDDIEDLNGVFAEAFTDRYRRDGLVGVRVPRLNPRVWRYAIEDAGGGALLWRDRANQVVAFNMVHQSGAEGWMGPLAVRPDQQGRGLGKRIVEAGIRWLESRGATVVGLETMPRTVDNIGFYSRLGFVPRYLTVTLQRELEPTPDGFEPRHLSEGGLEAGLAACQGLTAALLETIDYTRELRVTADLQLGDTTLLASSGEVTAFGLWHSIPLAEGRPAEELRVLKVVAGRQEEFEHLVEAIECSAGGEGLRRVSFRCQTGYPAAYRFLVKRGYQVQWTDLRMTLADRDEPMLAGGVAFSNWEI
jgi:GNAT superfamily N-acetyltransferase